MIKPRILVIDDDYGDRGDDDDLDEVQRDLVSKFDPSERCDWHFCSGKVGRRNSLEGVLHTAGEGWPPGPANGGKSWALILLDVAFYQEPEAPGDPKWGFQVLAALRDRWPDLPVVMLTAEEKAKRTESNWAQADGFLSKPVGGEAGSPAAFLNRLYAFGLFPDLRKGARLAGSSLAMLKVLQEARRFACDPLGSGRILYGETGTGKSELARFIHEEMGLLVGRTGGFHNWSAAGVNADIIQAALFGHWKGAFFGANSSEPGPIERAHGGTFFLDEVASLTAGAQALFIESRRRDVRMRRLISRMGNFPTTPEKDRKQAEASVVPQPWKEHLQADHRIAVDVVILTASNVNLHDEGVADLIGFRRDLLNDLGAPIYIPSLNDRREDIREIFEQIVRQIVTQLGRPMKHVDDRVLSDLQALDWTKKNIVALRQMAEHAVIAARDFDEILVRHMPSTGPLRRWAGDRPTKSETHVRLLGDHAIPTAAGAIEAAATHLKFRTVADLAKSLDRFEVPADPASLEGVLPALQVAYARLVLKLFAAALRTTRDRRGESSTLSAVCKLLNVEGLKGTPESYAAYDILLRIVNLADPNFEGLPVERCSLLSDDPDVKERVQQAVNQRRRPKKKAP